MVEALQVELSHETLRKYLGEMGIRARVHAKTLSPTHYIHRDAQFLYIDMLRRQAHAQGWRVLSIDIKKREVLGRYRREGSTWGQEAFETQMYKPNTTLAREDVAVPWGAYEAATNQGYIWVGLSHSTAEFSASCLRKCLQDHVEIDKGSGLLLLSDAGGCDGYRSKLWRYFVQREVVDRFEIPVMVAHLPPGCSKYNPIEHRVFQPLTLSWKALPFLNTDILLETIEQTTNNTNLKLNAELTREHFKTGKTSKALDTSCLNVTPHSICPELNYTILPQGHSLEELIS